MFVFFLIPAILVLGAILFSLDPKLTLSQKISYFLILPILEIIIAIIATLQAKSMGINIIDAWQLYLLYFLFSFGIASTLMVTLLEELDYTVKLGIRIATLAVFGFIITWVYFSIE